jgi:hypothetical protein
VEEQRIEAGQEGVESLGAVSVRGVPASRTWQTSSGLGVAEELALSLEAEVPLLSRKLNAELPPVVEAGVLSVLGWIHWPEVEGVVGEALTQPACSAIPAAP